MHMLAALHDAIEKLPGLLADGEWGSVHVTYHPPRVERLWIQFGGRRLFLHRIHPCDDGAALFHPHPWPSAVRVVDGRYEHLVGWRGWGDDDCRRHVASRIVLREGAEYEMTDPEAWHSVRPLDGPSDSIMLVGPPYEPRAQMPSPPTEKQQPLSPDRFDELAEEWRRRFR